MRSWCSTHGTPVLRSVRVLADASSCAAPGEHRKQRVGWVSVIAVPPRAPTDAGQDPRHVGTIEPLFNLLDFTPEGRAPDWEEQLSYE